MADARQGALPADPYAEIRLIGLSAVRGANYWSRGPITRLDLTVGAFEDLSSADVAGVTDRLVAAMPGLEAHRCSIGERGGFITRLRRGTYAPHIIEHIALELQTLVGHAVGYGRSRGGDIDGSYTVVFGHAHEATGLRAASLALDVVQQAFAGTLISVEHVVAELCAIAATPDVPALTPHVACGVSGGPMRTLLRTEIARRLTFDSELVVEVNPAAVLQAGLSYATSDMAVILDGDLVGVPDRYRDEERTWRLLAVLIDAVPRGGVIVAPAKAWSLQDEARGRRRGVAIFSGANDVTDRDRRVARSVSWVFDGEVIVEHRGAVVHTEARLADVEPAVQAAAAMVQFTMQSSAPSVSPVVHSPS